MQWLSTHTLDNYFVIGLKGTDEDKQDDIYEYFREEAETESIDAALEELGEEEYSEEEIRLMRIKFFSELGN